MKISVKIKPNAKENSVGKSGKVYIVKVKQVAKEGKANKAMVKVLAEFFDVSKSQVEIVSGLTSKQKIVEISGI